VTEPEPLPPDHPLWRAPGTIITPHVRGDTGSMSKRMDALVAEQVRRAIAAEPFLHVVIDTR
jgi:phosphoglycerate dehydrogenase-like enzyme